MVTFLLVWREIPATIALRSRLALLRVATAEQALQARLAAHSLKEPDGRTNPAVSPEVQALLAARRKALTEHARALGGSRIALTELAMAALCRRMLEFGMAKVVPTLPAPDPARYGVSPTELAAYQQQRRANQPLTPSAGLRAYLDALHAHQANNFGAGVIPIHKLTTPEGWIVTPDELHAALAKAPERPSSRPAAAQGQGWTRWLTFCRQAAAHGGFVVTAFRRRPE
jgi:hypothetical protein